MYRHIKSNSSGALVTQIFGCITVLLLPLLGEAAPKAPGGFCAKGDTIECQKAAPAAAESISDAIKWHPGHYMQASLGDSSDANQSVRFGWYDEIGSNTAIEGVVLRLKWGQLESSKGNFTFDSVRAELAKLKSLPVPKRLFIRIHDRDYGPGGSECKSDNMYPADLRNSTGCAPTKNGNMARLWEPAITDRLIALNAAIAKEFDDEPYFEGIMPIRETATNGEVLDNSYSHAAYLTQLKRLSTEVSKLFHKSNVVMSVNFLGGQANVDEYITHNFALGLGQGGPDVLPDGVAKHRPLAYNTLDGSSTGVDYRKQMAVMYSIEASQLGGALCNSCMPSELQKFAEEALGATHLFWTRNAWSGSSAQQWQQGILPWINKNPVSNTDCPESYGACSE